MTSVPHSFHYLWEGRSFPYLNFLAIMSLRRMEPTADITVHLVNSDGLVGTVERLVEAHDIRVRLIDPRRILDELEPHFPGLTDTFDAIPSVSTSARSNVLRYGVLWLDGGVYLDLDTFILAPMRDISPSPAFIGQEVVWKGDAHRVRGDRGTLFSPSTWHWAASWCARRLDSRIASGRWAMAERLSQFDVRWQSHQVNNAVMGSEPQAEFVGQLLSNLPMCDPQIRYSTGPTLVDWVCAQSSTIVDVLPQNIFYPVAPGESFRLFEDLTLRIPDECHVIHYASSNHPRLVAETDFQYRPQVRPGSVMDRVMADIELWLADLPARSTPVARHG